MLTKVWELDGSITPHGKAKNHTVETFPVNNLRDVAVVLDRLLHRPRSCIVRGGYTGDEAAALIDDPERDGRFVRRAMPYFTDPKHHVLYIDIDKYTPLLVDPDAEPLAAILEFIRLNMPPEFIEASFHWALSSSAGHPSKAGMLNAHAVFWISRAMDSAECRAWATMNKLPIDRAFFHPVQAHFVAMPVFAAGVVDPVVVRSGFYDGLFGDEVALRVHEGALAVAVLNTRAVGSTGPSGIECVDPRLKRGVVGAFCRAFSIEDVLMADWFTGNFERVSERRYTWLDGNGAAQGAYLTDDGLRFVNTHNTSPLDTIGKGLNSYDLCRVYVYSHLDDAVEEIDRWNWDDIKTHPSEEAMRRFAMQLPEVRTELDKVSDADNPFGGEEVPEVDGDDVQAAADMSDLGIPAPAALPPEASDDERWGKVMGTKLKSMLHFLGVTADETARVIDGPVLTTAWRGCFYNPSPQKLYLLNKAGDLVLFAQADWGSMVSSTFGNILVPEVVDEVSQRLGGKTNTPAVKVSEELRKRAWGIFSDYVKLYRQRSELQYRVDLFATRATVSLTPVAAAVAYAHEPFRIRAVVLPDGAAEAMVAEYRAHFPFFDTVLDLFLHARFATDRREAFLWMRCMAGWGKGFLLDGVLGKDGLMLVTEMNVKDVERAFEGNPSAIQASDVVRAWCLAFDEFKAVKGELKQLNNSITAAPKNQMRFKCEVFVKLFLSAEGVDSLAGADGVEQQFADRFAIHEVPDGARSVDDLPLFSQYGKAAYRAVLANHAAGILNEGVERMRALGKMGASKAGDDWLRRFHAAHSIANTYALLGSNLPEMADELRSLALDWARRSQGMPLGGHGRLEHLQPALRSALDRSVEVVRGGRSKAVAGETPGLLVVLTKPHALVKAWVNATKDRSEAAMISHKAGQIALLLCGGGVDGARGLKDGVHYYASGERRKAKGVVLALVEHAQAAEAGAGATFVGNTVVFPDFSAGLRVRD